MALPFTCVNYSLFKNGEKNRHNTPDSDTNLKNYFSCRKYTDILYIYLFIIYKLDTAEKILNEILY